MNLHGLESEFSEQGRELFTGIFFGQLQVGSRDRTVAHEASCFPVHLFLGTSVPITTLIEGTSASLIDKMIGKQTNGRQGGNKGIAVGSDPTFATLREVNA